MSHNLGPVISDGRTVTQASGIDLSFAAPVRFVILRFDQVNLPGGARLEVPLGYDTDVFTGASGAAFWSRPIDTSLNPIQIRIVGGSGSARLLELMRAEPTTVGTPGQPCGSTSNPDPFLHTNPYQEPDFESRLECNPGFLFRNSACNLPGIPDAVKDAAAAATGIIVSLHNVPGDRHLSSCSGTLIGSDLFLTARHCLSDPDGEDVRSASVCFEYATQCDGSRPGGHTGRFFKVREEVAGGPGDWVLVRLDAAPGTLPAPREMRDAVLMGGESIFTMHHPGGAVKKMQAGTHTGGFGITGFDFAGGSSGSALFDVQGRLVRGPLSFGGSCFSPGACFVTYTDLAPIIAAITNPPPPPNPLDVMIVFDRSGSMASAAPPAGRTKLEEAQDAASLFVQLVREGAGDRLGLVTFSSTAALPRAPGAVATVKPLLIGPPPFTTGDIGAIAATGATSIGAGLGAALLAFGSGSGNDRAILLLSDGLQNTAPMVEEVEGFLGSTKVSVIGFGSDAQIDGPLLSRVARDHSGDFTRAVDGLTLRKFFGLSFGNIFENGALSDPEHVLPANANESQPHAFQVCGEERITIIVGWNDQGAPVRARIRTPSGRLLTERTIETARGRTWLFWRIPLPNEGERDGTWTVVVERVPIGGEFPPPPAALKYFLLVTCAGGPRLTYIGGQTRAYTGDVIHPRVRLGYPNATTPPASVQLTIEGPGIALGQLVVDRGLLAPALAADPIASFHATLQDIERAAGGTLPVQTRTITVPLHDDGNHDDGAMEPDGIFNNPLKDLTRFEGTYSFRAVATYGVDCRSTREAMWSIHVEPRIDPGHTGVVVVTAGPRPGGGFQGTIRIEPRDSFGNPLGPGRPHVFDVSGVPGTTVTGTTIDNGDGTYDVPVEWVDVEQPGIVITQPDAPPVTIRPPAGKGCLVTPWLIAAAVLVGVIVGLLVAPMIW
jgi:hypothetical protein